MVNQIPTITSELMNNTVTSVPVYTVPTSIGAVSEPESCSISAVVVGPPYYANYNMPDPLLVNEGVQLSWTLTGMPSDTIGHMSWDNYRLGRWSIPGDDMYFTLSTSTYNTIFQPTDAFRATFDNATCYAYFQTNIPPIGTWATTTSTL